MAESLAGSKAISAGGLGMGAVRLSPDGTKVTFVHAAGTPGLEISALENFLPAQTARPAAKR
jgi:hypothetical protein